jgi:hypothetical protein
MAIDRQVAIVVVFPILLLPQNGRPMVYRIRVPGIAYERIVGVSGGVPNI